MTQTPPKLRSLQHSTPSRKLHSKSKQNDGTGHDGGISLWRQVRLLEQTNGALTSNIDQLQLQVQNLRDELAAQEAKHEKEKAQHIQRGSILLRDLHAKLREIRKQGARIQDAERQLAAARKREEEEEEEEEEDGDGASALVLQELQSKLEAAELETKIHRCALLSTYKMLPSLEEGGQLSRILQLSRRHFTGVDGEEDTALPRWHGGGGEMETPRQEALELPLTPPGSSDSSQDDACRTPRRGGLRPRKGRANEFGSPCSR